jgi:hypothetical protein
MSNSGDHHNAGFDPDGEASKISIEPEGVSSGANVTTIFRRKSWRQTRRFLLLLIPKIDPEKGS